MAITYFDFLVSFCFVLRFVFFIFCKKEPTSLKIQFYFFINLCETGMPFWNWMLAEDKLTKEIRYFSLVHYITKNRGDWDSRNCRFLGKHLLGFLRKLHSFLEEGKAAKPDSVCAGTKLYGIGQGFCSHKKAGLI